MKYYTMGQHQRGGILLGKVRFAMTDPFCFSGNWLFYKDNWASLFLIIYKRTVYKLYTHITIRK